MKDTLNMTIKVCTVVLNRNATGDQGSVTAMATTSLTRGNRISAAKTLPERTVATCLYSVLPLTTTAKHTGMYSVTRCAKITIVHIHFTKMPTADQIMHSTIL